MHTHETSQNKNHIAEVLATHERRLMAIQVALQKDFQQKGIDQQHLAPRLAHIKSCLKDVQDLAAWHRVDDQTLAQETNLGLPALDQCSLEERTICLAFLKRRHALLEDLLKESTQAYGWVVDACRGKGWGWMSILRLSKLKRFLQKLDSHNNGLLLDNAEQEVILNQLAKSVARHQTSYVRDNLEALIKLFNSLDYSAAKLAHLKSKIRRERSTVHEMQQYLKQYEQSAMAKTAPVQSPSLATTIDVIEKMSWRHPASVSGTAKKLTLARSFLRDQVSSSENNAHSGRKP